VCYSRAVQTSRKVDLVFWILVIGLFLVTRGFAMAEYLSIDDVNLAFSLENFDPRLHQPQPPGYPLFVLFARAINLFFNDAHTTFVVASLIACGLCLPLTFAVGQRLFNRWTGMAATLLFAVNPPFWFGSLEGPLRPHLALFSLLTAYCCWRCWQGEKQFAIWGAVALGVGSGFRPDLGPYLFPLWLLSAWMGTRSLVAVGRGLVVMAAIVFAWIAGMAYAVGGFAALYQTNAVYAVDQTVGPGAVFGAGQRASLRQLGRLFVWNSYPWIVSLWALPIVFKMREKPRLLSSQSVFMIAWLLPGLLLQAMVHLGDPPHVLFGVPAMCVIAAYLMYAATQQAPELREVILAIALVVNTMLFLDFLALPASAAPAGGWRSLKNVFVFGTYETSIGQVRFLDATSRLTLKEMHEFTPADRPTTIVTSDLDLGTWFMNWRIARYYVPNYDIWVTNELQSPPSVLHIRRDRTLAANRGDSLQVPIPKGGRVIWLLEPGGPFQRKLKEMRPETPGGAYLSYTDIPTDAQPFKIMNFEFVPTTPSTSGAN